MKIATYLDKNSNLINIDFSSQKNIIDLEKVLSNKSIIKYDFRSNLDDFCNTVCLEINNINKLNKSAIKLLEKVNLDVIRLIKLSSIKHDTRSEYEARDCSNSLEPFTDTLVHIIAKSPDFFKLECAYFVIDKLTLYTLMSVCKVSFFK